MNYAEMERYNEVGQLVYEAVEALEKESILVTVQSVYDFLKGQNTPVDKSKIREQLQEWYPGDVIEEAKVCPGCPGEWCKGCTPW